MCGRFRMQSECQFLPLTLNTKDVAAFPRLAACSTKAEENLVRNGLQIAFFGIDSDRSVELVLTVLLIDMYAGNNVRPLVAQTSGNAP